MTSRRDAITTLMGLPFAKSVSEITKESRLLVLTLQERYDAAYVEIDCDAIRAQIDDALKKAGLRGIEVLILVGLDAKVIDKK